MVYSDEEPLYTAYLLYMERFLINSVVLNSILMSYYQKT